MSEEDPAGDIDLLEGINLEIQRLMFGNIRVRPANSHQRGDVLYLNYNYLK